MRVALILLIAVVAAGCTSGGRLFKPKYEYEEELYLALDGSATLNLNASVAALVALRGADLDPNPRARIDRNGVRALFQAPGVTPSVSLARGDGRRFVHVTVNVDDVTTLSRLAPLSWSAYYFNQRGDTYEFRQTVGPPRGRSVGEVGWTGGELVAFRVHLPSQILFHNAPSRTVERGNILEWEQPLTDRLAGHPLDIQVRLEPRSILYTTLLLFGSTIIAAAAAFGIVIWWIRLQ